MKKLLLLSISFFALAGCDKLEGLIGSEPKQSLICDAHVDEAISEKYCQIRSDYQYKLPVVMSGSKLHIDGGTGCYSEFSAQKFKREINTDVTVQYQASHDDPADASKSINYLFNVSKVNGDFFISRYVRDKKERDGFAGRTISFAARGTCKNVKNVVK